MDSNHINALLSRIDEDAAQANRILSALQKAKRPDLAGKVVHASASLKLARAKLREVLVALVN